MRKTSPRLLAAGNLEQAREDHAYLVDKLADLQQRCEAAITRAGRELPYFKDLSSDE